MSDEDPCSSELSAAVSAFTQRGTVEPGLDVDGDALLQLRKACRILDEVRALRDIDRHHTLVVEGSFAALDRTVQFYMIDRGLIEVDDLMNQIGYFKIPYFEIPYTTVRSSGTHRITRSIVGATTRGWYSTRMG